MRNVFSLLLLAALIFPVIGIACDHYDPFGDRPNNNAIVDEGN
ncbi:hypothetical protein [Fastidiosibacter lacustris]|nr:hypothetical protein [Fastidiosibacter lacustris]